MTDDFYPPKPELVEPKQKSSLSVTIFSLVLFVLAFMLFFGDEINFIVYLQECQNVVCAAYGGFCSR
jgi:hypothetical protein